MITIKAGFIIQPNEDVQISNIKKIIKSPLPEKSIADMGDTSVLLHGTREEIINAIHLNT